MLELPTVSLVMHDTSAHELARMAVEDSIRNVRFAEVIICTDRPLEFSPLTQFGCTPRIHVVPDAPDKLGWCRQNWYEAQPQVRTSHILLTQWDSWVWDATCWRDEFLRYDYVGAPWPFHSTLRVGNSGFCLKSTRLARYLASRRDQFPCDSEAEDALICRKYRPQLERAGFLWAPEKLAAKFAFECATPTGHTFGFHSAMNFPLVLDEARLRERVELMASVPHILNGFQMQALCKSHPEKIKKILDDQPATAEPLAKLMEN